MGPIFTVTKNRLCCWHCLRNGFGIHIVRSQKDRTKQNVQGKIFQIQIWYIKYIKYYKISAESLVYFLVFIIHHSIDLCINTQQSYDRCLFLSRFGIGKLALSIRTLCTIRPCFRDVVSNFSRNEMKETLRLFNSSTHANKSITLRETLEISAFCISKNI